MISILRAGPYLALSARLDAAVAANPALAPARARLLLPLELLDALARDAEAALADDALAAARMRLVLVAGAAQAVPAMASSALLEKNEPASDASSGELGAAPSAGVVHLGALVIVALAAARVGAASSMEVQLVKTVFGLALAAGLVEAIAGADGTGLSDEQLRVVLAALTAPQATSEPWSGALGSFVVEPGERARWSCLGELQALVLKEATSEKPWDGALAQGIASLKPLQVCPGAEMSLLGQFARMQKSTVRLVFAAPNQPTLASAAVASSSKMTAKAPAGVRPGWAGYTDAPIQKLANDWRRQLRENWSVRNQTARCLSDTPVPLESIRDLPDPPAPPLTAANRFHGGAPSWVSGDLLPARYAPGEKLTLRWAVAGASSVRLEPLGRELPSTGTLQLEAASLPADAKLTLRAQNPCGTSERALSASPRTVIARISVAQGERTGELIAGVPFEVRAELSPPAPADAFLVVGNRRLASEVKQGKLAISLPASDAKTGFTATLQVGPKGFSEPDDTKAVGPISFVTVLTLVVVRPAIFSPKFSRVSDAQLWAAMQKAQAGFALNIIEPAWLEDEDLSVDGPVADADGPAAADLLERLQRFAGKQPGLEDAIWVALLPTVTEQLNPPEQEGGTSDGPPLLLRSAVRTSDGPPPSSSVVRALPAEAARAVAVATIDDLAAALRSPPEPKPPAPRLRLIGNLDKQLRVSLEPARLESRGAGPGAPIDTGVVAVAIENGRDLVRRSVTATRAGLPVDFVCLLPISTGVTAVELRRGGVVLAHLDRPPGRPSLADTLLADDTLRWSYTHSQGMQARAAIEVSQGGGGWCPVLYPGVCDRSATLPVNRLRADGREFAAVRVVASDGWTAAEAEPERSLPLPVRPVVARQAGALRFWADTTDGGQISWKLGSETFRGPSLELKEGARGLLTLIVADGEATFTDSRTIGG